MSLAIIQLFDSSVAHGNKPATWVLSSFVPKFPELFLCVQYLPEFDFAGGWPEDMRDVQWESTLAQLTPVLQYGRSSTAEWRSSTMSKAIEQRLLVLLSLKTKDWLVMLLRTRLPPTQPILSLVIDHSFVSGFLYLSMIFLSVFPNNCWESLIFLFSRC